MRSTQLRHYRKKKNVELQPTPFRGSFPLALPCFTQGSVSHGSGARLENEDFILLWRYR